MVLGYTIIALMTDILFEAYEVDIKRISSNDLKTEAELA